MGGPTQRSGVIALALAVFIGVPAARGQFAVGSNGQLAIGGPTSVTAASSRLVVLTRQLVATVRGELAGSGLGRYHQRPPSRSALTPSPNRRPRRGPAVGCRHDVVKRLAKPVWCW